jgi:CDP-glycerol glycerophosphotransferase (TagB/SpsB family)
MMSDMLVMSRLALVRLGFRLGGLLPIRRRVVLATAHAVSPGGNLAVIRNELARRLPEVPVREVTHRPARGLRSKASAAWHAILAGFLLATSRLFVVDDYFFPIYAIRPRHGTTIVQAWHASGAFKKFGYSLAGKTFGADAAVLRRVRIHANYDLCLVSSASVIPHYAEAFGLPAERFTSRIGIPRTDRLLDPAWRRQSTADVRARYAIPGHRRVLLYAPTYRGERTLDARHPTGLDLRALAETLGDDHVLLLRLHPFVRSRLPIDHGIRSFVIDASAHPDVHPLLAASDVLITDYSSVIFEFSLLDRPMAFFAPDHAAYEQERGFYFDYVTGVPGPVFERTEDLAEHLRRGSFDLERVRRFRRASFDIADGRASERFVERVVRPALSGRA